MPVDFSTLVLVPAMNTFAEAVIIDPLVSQPGQPPYPARGVFSSGPVEVTLQDGTIFRDQRTTLGIRVAEFAVSPAARDRVTVRGQMYFAGDFNDDGQGGATLELRKVVPEEIP